MNNFRRNKYIFIILILIIVLFGLGWIIIQNNNTEESKTRYEKNLCQKYLGEYVNEEEHTLNDALLMQDCAEYCPKLNMKYSKSQIASVDSCGIRDCKNQNETPEEPKTPDCYQNAVRCFCE